MSLGVGNGAELILRNIPVIRPGWRLLSAFLALMIGAALYIAWNNPAFKVTGMTVKGNHRISSADVRAVADLNGQPIFTADPRSIAKQVSKAFPDVMNVTAEVSSPAKILVSFEERDPVVAWENGGATYWVDATGFIFMAHGKASPPVAINADIDPPTVETIQPVSTGEDSNSKSASLMKEGKSPENTSLVGMHMAPLVLKAAIRLGSMLPEGTKLRYSSLKGLGWSDKDGWDVYVGVDLTNIETKLVVYKAVLKQIDNDGVKATLISVENPDTPYYRLEK